MTGASPADHAATFCSDRRCRLRDLQLQPAWLPLQFRQLRDSEFESSECTIRLRKQYRRRKNLTFLLSCFPDSHLNFLFLGSWFPDSIHSSGLTRVRATWSL